MDHTIDITNINNIKLYYMITNEYFLDKSGPDYKLLYEVINYILHKINSEEYFLNCPEWKLIWEKEEKNLFKFFLDGKDNIDFFTQKRTDTSVFESYNSKLIKDNMFIPFSLNTNDRVQAVAFFIKHTPPLFEGFDSKIPYSGTLHFPTILINFRKDLSKNHNIQGLSRYYAF